MQKYNTENLKPFTKENASYYGSKGGIASGRTRLKQSIKHIQYQLYFLYNDLEPYRHRKRIYKRELDKVKYITHKIKIYNNRLVKLQNKYNQKYDIKA